MAISNVPGKRTTRRIQWVTSTGTFTLPVGYGASKPFIATVKLYGGGGGGGGGASNSSTWGGQAGLAGPKGGGGGGSGFAFVYEDLLFTSNLSFAIGAGGTGGAGGANSTGNGASGTNGGMTSLNSQYFAPGGGGGGGGGIPAILTHPSTTAPEVNATAQMRFFIPARRTSSSTSGTSVGGAGGSAGFGISNSSGTSTIGVSGSGGSYGGTGGTSASSMAPEFLNQALAAEANLSICRLGESTVHAVVGFSRWPDFNQRGGGGAGGDVDYATSVAHFAEGGFAGGLQGGLNGRTAYRTNYGGTLTQINGQNATVYAGGGGGGGARNYGGAGGGTGGNGAQGYAEIIWIEEV